VSSEPTMRVLLAIAYAFWALVMRRVFKEPA
jgi:hypothetical protein